ncbi:MAG: condensation domain-containing protein, partial [Bacillota bacterium]
PNGKADRKALPEPIGSINTGTEYVEPTGIIERKLAKIWQEVLGALRVGINDDFFELGGDSIKAIQVISLLAREGIDIEVEDILVYRTISRILLNTDYKNNLKEYEQGVAEGSFGFTPIVQWFFSRGFSNPGYYNQSVLLELKKDIDITNLEKAFKKIVEHHDGLRLNYSPDTKELYFNNEHLHKGFKIETFDISGLALEKQEQEMERIGVKLKSEFDITDGLLIKVAVINFGVSGRKLLITIHHLVIDGVSWRIILEDLYTVYTSIENQRKVIMPKKSASLKECYERMRTLKDSPRLLEEKEFWISSDSVGFKLPEDYETLDWSISARASVKGRLGKGETAKLVKEAHKAYNTCVEDLLLTALAKTINEWTGSREMVIEMENHGRNIDGIDVSRTVGWFTVMYPLRLEITRDNTGEQIREIKEQIREVPENGIGYGILKYLGGDMPENRGRVPELRFNYLGRFDKEANNDFFAYSDLYSGSDTCSTNPITAKLEINCMVVNDVFELDIYFNKKTYKEETILNLRDKYLGNLMDTVFYTTTSDDVYFTPSDFETLDINQEDLDMLFD